MKESLYYIFAITSGIFFSTLWGGLNTWDFSSIFLPLLLFVIGLEIGATQTQLKKLTSYSSKILLVPLGTIFGTYVSALCFSIIFPIFTLRESLLIASGFGFYSLSSSMVSAQITGNLGMIVFFTNLFREFFVLLFAKQIVSLFGKDSLIPVSASASDMCIPVISAHLCEEKVFEAIFNSILFTILVPIFIESILKW
jgi:uncharacterized membrane protein YbjE (DUF340 family)